MGSHRECSHNLLRLTSISFTASLFSSNFAIAPVVSLAFITLISLPWLNVLSCLDSSNRYYLHLFLLLALSSPLLSFLLLSFFLPLSFSPLRFSDLSLLELQRMLLVLTNSRRQLLGHL